MKLEPCKYCGCIHIKQSAIYSEDYGYIGYYKCENCGAIISTTSNDFLHGENFSGSTRYEGIKNVKNLWNKVMSSDDFNEYVTRGVLASSNLITYTATYKDDGHIHAFKVHSMKDLYREIKLYNKYIGKDEDILPDIHYKEFV